MKNTLLELQTEIHETALKKGFWEEDNNLINALVNDMSIPAEIAEEIKAIQEQFIIPKKLMLIVSELGEALESLRNRSRADGEIYYANKFLANNRVVLFEKYMKDTFEDEIADTIIRLLDLCGYLKINIEAHIAEKMEYNRSRPKLHGKTF